MPRISRPDGLTELLDRQLAVASRAQLLALGMTSNAIQYRARAGGPWQALLPGVYLSENGPPSLPQKEMAALIYAGPRSLITGSTALLHHGLRGGPPTGTIDVLVPVGRARGSTGFVRIHRTARMPARVAVSGPVRLALVPRAVADTAWQLGQLGEVRAVVADAVQLGKCTVSELAGELQSGPVRGSAMFRSVLGEVAEGIRSTAEGDLRDLIGAARLPMPLFNPSLYDGETFLGKPDAWWPDAGVAGEVDSREWHLGPEGWDRTRRRHDLMAAAGIIVLHFSPRELRQNRVEVARMIRDTLKRGLSRPSLPIRAVPCPGSEPMVAAT